MNILYNKRWVAWGLLVLLFLLLLFGLTHAIIVIKNPLAASDMHVQMRVGQTPRKLVIKSGSTKIILTRPGSNYVSLSANNMTTGYQIHARRFLIPEKINPVLIAQKSTTSLGSSDTNCSINISNSNNTVYYECRGVPGDLYLTNGLVSSISASMENSVMPYMDGLLQLTQDENSPVIKQVDVKNNLAATSSKKISVPTTATSAYEMQTDNYSRSNPLITLLDKNSPNNIYLLSNSTADTYRSLVVPHTKIVKDYSVITRLVGNKIYVFRGLPASSNKIEADQVAFSDFSDPQAFSIINADTSKNSSYLKFKNSFRVQNLFVSPSGIPIVLATDDKNSEQAFYEINQNKLIKLDTLGDLKDDLVWKNSDVFYYISGNELFEYSLTNKISNLVYSNIDSTISALSTFPDGVYFSVFKGTDNKLSHYELGAEDLSGPRPESVLPINENQRGPLISARLYKNSLYVEPRDFPISDFVKNNALVYLQNLGINYKKYNVVFK